jgi:hypothetical protein
MEQPLPVAARDSPSARERAMQHLPPAPARDA